MPPVRLGPKDLLEYDANYGVIICRECQYAIQKSALQSHLLRHKIFRHKRHSLLNSISRFTILEPEDVILPTPDSKPIAALPTISGFRCAVRKCDSLFASAKRMRRHQLESHDISEAESSDSSIRPVTLQTFFRGTKIKYFEVTSAGRATTTRPAPKASREDTVAEHDLAGSEGEDDSKLPNPSTTSAADFNLQSLVYFHHFKSATCSTLPHPDPKQPLYWQTEFLSQALQQRWLMAGLLALSASHMGALTHQASPAIAHHDRSVKFQTDFENGWKTNTQGAFNTSHRGIPTPREAILQQLSSMIACAHATFPFKTPDTTLEALITPMRGLTTTQYRSRPSGAVDDAFSRAARLLDLPIDDPVLASILARLDTLPSRMADALGRPDDPHDAVTALSATATLIGSCIEGFESDDAFWAMATWICRVGEQFHQLLARENPAALLVLAHWAAALVWRVEEDGCWFLNGAAGTILGRVGELLPPDRPAIQDLIGDL
ncbi:hypothetical protein C7974DRAFT_148255 [Boeremia exigua]|uniref:uncharacterized protein n=1 Tax=Boeremia exigua TaxID=749465 RepID=UPI001E8DC544|nr:uncharacterized protein C7974DRAFT_148255 [Boeremia exigua]KAH6637777.1 hypothetical protein C7974DRAFT_148255 [Boeremia exigua]